MRYAIVYSALVAGAAAHGLITEVNGANGVTMPGLTVADGTPRDCSTNSCGSQADTAIIRDREMGSSQASALGRTQGNGPVDASKNIASFMSGAQAPTNKGAASSVGVEDNIPGALGGGGNGGNGAGNSRPAGGAGLFGGLTNMVSGLTGGILRRQSGPETMISEYAGMGAQQGLPTAQDDGTINMKYLQVNQDGAGPLTCAIDATSCGTDPNAFQTGQMTKNPGFGVLGLSLATRTTYDVACKMPEGMKCTAECGGAKNVCIARVRNNAVTGGPFGGSGAFTQSPAARKRAIAFRLKKRMEIGGREEN